jgi:hypothetical protein
MKLKENIVFLWMKESVGEGWMVDVGFLVGGWWLVVERRNFETLGVALTKQTNKRGRAKERETQIFWHHSACIIFELTFIIRITTSTGTLRTVQLRYNTLTYNRYLLR